MHISYITQQIKKYHTLNEMAVFSLRKLSQKSLQGIKNAYFYHKIKLQESTKRITASVKSGIPSYPG
jgi:hypothetical protein